jgi:pyruvate formate lyase activating enzyme
VTGRWWSVEADGKKLRCELCPRQCTLGEGQRGFCFIREARAGQIVLTSYGRASGFCVDPIEKKPLNHFYPGTSVLSFGTAGCNLGCRFCQNWDISKAAESDRLTDRATPEAVAAAAQQAGCKSVAFTYNDPVIFAEYAIDCARACHELGVQTVAVTAGYIGAQARKELFSVIDAANVDLKAFTEAFYQKQCFGHLQPVLDTLRYLKNETSVWLEITTLLIPGENDSVEEVARMCDWLAANIGVQVPIHFSAFHPDFKVLDRPRTPPGTLSRARKQALEAGIKHVYTGNVHDPQGQSTRCAGCSAEVIGRDGYTLGAWKLSETGHCIQCGQAMAGHFDPKPGTWGGRRARVRMV